MKIWILGKKEYFSISNFARFVEVAKQMNINLNLVSPDDFDLIITKDGKKDILHNGKSVDLPDCLIPRTGSGTSYFALAVIRYMENKRVLVLNSSSSIEMAKDKLATIQNLVSNNIPVPKTMLAKFPLNIDMFEKEFTYPVIVKTVVGSYGKGVFLCEKRAKLQDVMDLIEISKDYRVNVILQEFVSASKGKDIRVIVIGGRAIGAILRTAKKGKYKANYSAGGNVYPFELNPSVEWLAVESARLLNLEIAGVDILFDGRRYKVCEVNSAPGYEGFEKATKINVPELIFEYAKLRLGKKS